MPDNEMSCQLGKYSYQTDEVSAVLRELTVVGSEAITSAGHERLEDDRQCAEPLIAGQAPEFVVIDPSTRAAVLDIKRFIDQPEKYDPQQVLNTACRNLSSFRRLMVIRYVSQEIENKIDRGEQLNPKVARLGIMLEEERSRLLADASGTLSDKHEKALSLLKQSKLYLHLDAGPNRERHEHFSLMFAKQANEQLQEQVEAKAKENARALKTHQDSLPGLMRDSPFNRMQLEILRRDLNEELSKYEEDSYQGRDNLIRIKLKLQAPDAELKTLLEAQIRFGNSTPERQKRFSTGSDLTLSGWLDAGDSNAPEPVRRNAVIKMVRGLHVMQSARPGDEEVSMWRVVAYDVIEKANMPQLLEHLKAADANRVKALDKLALATYVYDGLPDSLSIRTGRLNGNQTGTEIRTSDLVKLIALVPGLHPEWHARAIIKTLCPNSGSDLAASTQQLVDAVRNTERITVTQGMQGGSPIQHIEIKFHDLAGGDRHWWGTTRDIEITLPPPLKAGPHPAITAVRFKNQVSCDVVADAAGLPRFQNITGIELDTALASIAINEVRFERVNDRFETVVAVRIRPAEMARAFGAREQDEVIRLPMDGSSEETMRTVLSYLQVLGRGAKADLVKQIHPAIKLTAADITLIDESKDIRFNRWGDQPGLSITWTGKGTREIPFSRLSNSGLPVDPRFVVERNLTGSPNKGILINFIKEDDGMALTFKGLDVQIDNQSWPAYDAFRMAFRAVAPPPLNFALPARLNWQQSIDWVRIEQGKGDRQLVTVKLDPRKGPLAGIHVPLRKGKLEADSAVEVWVQGLGVDCVIAIPIDGDGNLSPLLHARRRIDRGREALEKTNDVMRRLDFYPTDVFPGGREARKVFEWMSK